MGLGTARLLKVGLGLPVIVVPPPPVLVPHARDWPICHCCGEKSDLYAEALISLPTVWSNWEEGRENAIVLFVL